MDEAQKTIKVTGHKGLVLFPMVRLLAGIIDPEEKEDVEDIKAAICEKFDIEYADDKGFIYRLQNALAMVWRKSKQSEDRRDILFEVPIIGSIRLIKTYMLYYYIKGGVRYEVEHHPTAVIEVNNRIIESRVWDDSKMTELEGEIRTMFERYNDADDYSEYFYMIEAVFKKGNMDISIFRSACDQLTEEIYQSDEVDYPEAMTMSGKFIFDRYMDYLWGMEDESRPNVYRLGINNFIHQNLPHWLNGSDSFKLKCNIYADEHKQVVEMFKAKESHSQYLHKIADFLNLRVWNGWMKSKRNTLG